MIWAVFLAGAALSFSLLAFGDDGSVFKWTDPQGRVRYGDSFPPNVRSDGVLRSEGGVFWDMPELSGREKKKSSRSPESFQERKKRALLATYSSVEDIISMRDRIIAYLEKSKRNLGLQMGVLQKRRDDLVEEISKDSLDAQSLQDLKRSLSAIEKAFFLQGELLERKNADISAIRKRFDNDIRLFKDLTGM